MNQSWKSDLKLIIATSLLLVVEVLWLLMHLQILPSPWKQHNARLEQKPAGFVVKAQRELRKRGLNSLVWENASNDDALFYYDSILTLSQSAATLHLNEQTEVHLSENTLVTIEPQSAANDSQIRLKFTRGDLRARNPFAATKIESNEWTLNLNQGSEVSLRQTGKDDFEVEVLKGNLDFEKDSTKQSLAENQVLKIEDNKLGETLAVADNLKFEGPEYQRIYSYQAEAHIPVAWKGEAENIQIVPLGKDKVVKTVSAGQSLENLALEPGKYTLRLAKAGKVSEAKEIEVWQAPSLHLLSPFPRDRVKTNENISFIWSYIPEAKEYKFVITDTRTGKITEKRVSTNSAEFNFLDESDVQWKVIGIDPDGFEMPSPYANQIFPRHEPFAAPKLKSPEMRVPASSKPKKKPDSSHLRPRTSLWSLIWKALNHEAFAAAEKKPADYEAVFAWEPVDEADIYTIEISDTPDFRNPKVSKTLKRTEFVWSKFELGTYFWRVAAGSSKGRMGVFSEPAKVNLEKIPEGKDASSDGVLIRKKPEAIAKQEKLEKQREPVITKTEEILADVPKTSFEEERFEQKVKLVSDEQRDLKESFLLEWTPLLLNWDLNGEDQLKAKMGGSTTGAGHFQTEQLLSPEQSYFADVSYSQYRWKASDPTTYPFQEDQSVTELRAQILFGNNKSSLLRGGIVQTVPYIERKGLEKIEVKTAWTVGPSVYFSWKDSERWKSGHSISLMAGSQIFAFSTQNRFRYLYYKGEQTAASIGLQLQGDLVFYQRSFSNGWGAGITLGFEH